MRHEIVFYINVCLYTGRLLIILILYEYADLNMRIDTMHRYIYIFIARKLYHKIENK